MRLTLFASLLAVSSHSLPARAEPLSRGAAIARALRQNPQLAAARAVEDQARAHKGQADAARWPAVSVTAAVGPSLKAKLVPGTGALSTKNQYGDIGWDDLSVALGGELSVLQPIYTFGKIRERARAAEHELKARQAQTQMTRAELAVTVAQLYEGLLFARDAGRFFVEVERWLVRSQEGAKRELENDTQTKEHDILRFDAGIGAIRLNIHMAEAAQRQAEAGLVAYLGFATGSHLEPREPEFVLLDSPVPDAAALIALARKQRPELSALSEASAAFSALADAEAAGALPDVFALLFASGGYTPGRDVASSRYVRDPLNGFYPGFLVGMRWQITGPMASERADENRAKARELSQTQRWVTAGVPAEVVKAYEDVQRARADAISTDEAVRAAKRWSVLASADYSVGLGDVRELADSKQAYVQLRGALYDATYRYNVALAQLARATGGFNSAAGDPRIYPIAEEHEHAEPASNTPHP